MDFPSFTKTYHQKSYPAISPLNPHLSLRGKNVLITGGGTGIGRATAIAFSLAGASNVIIGGRRRSKLEETQKLAQAAVAEQKGSTTRIHVFEADVTNETSIASLFEQVSKSIGSIDVLVSNAGALPEFSGTIDMDIADNWSTFEVNVKGTMIVTRAYLQHVAAQKIEEPIFIYVNSGASFVTVPGSGVYGAGKAASTRLIETAQVNHPTVRFINLQPGVIASEMSARSQLNPVWDEVELPANFMVWLSSPEAAFLKGRFIFANWDVEEMKAKKAEFEADPALLTGTLHGWHSMTERSPIVFK